MAKNIFKKAMQKVKPKPNIANVAAEKKIAPKTQEEKPAIAGDFETTDAQLVSKLQNRFTIKSATRSQTGRIFVFNATTVEVENFLKEVK